MSEKDYRLFENGFKGLGATLLLTSGFFFASIGYNQIFDQFSEPVSYQTSGYNCDNTKSASLKFDNTDLDVTENIEEAVDKYNKGK